MRSPADYLVQSNEQIGDLLAFETSEQQASSDLVEPPASPTVDSPVQQNHNSAPASSHSNNALITTFERAKTSNTVLKVGSRGDTVKALQEFLNLYFKTSTRVDGDFGRGTETTYKRFQAAEKLPQTGQVGSQGFTRMIEWLEKN